MAIALVSHVSAANASTGATSSAIDTTGASLLVVVLVYYEPSTAPTITDSKSNSWTGLSVTSITNEDAIKILYAQNPTVGSGHTFTVSGAATYPSICVAAFSGTVTASVFDVENGNSSTGAVTSITTGSITPAQDNELIVAGLCQYTGGTPTIDNGLSVADSVNQNAGVYFASGLAWKQQGVAAAINPAWSFASTPNVVARIASFKAAAGGAAVPVRPVRVLQAVNRAGTY